MADEVPLELIGARLPLQPTIVELGGHRGDTLRKLMRFAPKRYVVAEADPRNEAQLRDAVAPYTPVVRLEVPVAIVGEGRQFRTATLHQSASRLRGRRQPWTSSSSVLRPTKHLERFPDVSFSETVEVATATLSELLDRYVPAGEKIDLLWMDIEGMEREVLETLPPLQLERVQLINLESHPDALHEGAWSRFAAKVWLANHGFELVGEADQDILVARTARFNETEGRGPANPPP